MATLTLRAASGHCVTDACSFHGTTQSCKGGRGTCLVEEDAVRKGYLLHRLVGGILQSVVVSDVLQAVLGVHHTQHRIQQQVVLQVVVCRQVSGVLLLK